MKTKQRYGTVKIHDYETAFSQVSLIRKWWANDVSVPRKVTPGLPGWNFYVECPGLIFLAAVDLARLLRRAYSGLFGLYPSSLSKSVGFVFLSGKASLVSISAAILFLRFWHVYFPLEFEFRGKSCVEWEHVGENGTSCFLPCILLL